MSVMLPDAEWRYRHGVESLLHALGAEKGKLRYVGGAVRDSLLGLDVSDIDLATSHRPEAVLKLLSDAGIKAVPTGMAHGTITAVVDSRPYEITTLRSDANTDGRRATVAYSEDWEADSCRRDFTINALYADPVSGEIFDYHDGLADLKSRQVRFIGDAGARIIEDHLRILRFFRFFARFGSATPDADGYAACVAHANSLMALSRERIADELLKLLALPDPVPALRLMIDGGILRSVLPEIDSEGTARLAHLLEREAAAGLPASAILRLCALLPRDAAQGDAVAARLKLSNKARKRIALALSPPPPSRTTHELAFRVGVQGAQDIVLLDPAVDPAKAAAIGAWKAPDFPVGGAALIALGMPPGPDMARALTAIREQWIAEDFPGPERTHEIAVQITSKFQRDCQ